MALRVTQGIMYSTFNTQMNSNLSNLMESNIQSASQKRINRPSDDAAGAGKVVNLNASIAKLKQYQDNIGQAKGWLSLGAAMLGDGDGSVQAVLTRLMELAEQGATGTYTGSNREEMSFEIRELFMQLINISNTSFEGRRIFAGHKTDQPAYVAGLGVTCTDPALAGQTYQLEGDSSSTVLIQPLTSGTADTATYRYTSDGGKTWQNATVDAALPSPPYAAGKMRIDAGGVGVIFDAAATVTAVDPDNLNETNNGTWMYVRPTAIYQGDDSSNQVVSLYGTTTPATAQGNFTRDMSVRIDSVQGGLVTFSYSSDDGNNWTQGTAPDQGANTRLPVPAGYLSVSGTPIAGEQYIVHPHRAEIKFTISDSSDITVNLVGKNIFGGVYNDPSTPEAYPTVVGGSSNLFEAVGRLVAYAETNSQEGMQQALVDIKASMNSVLTGAAEVGGRGNRLAMTASNLLLRQYDEEDSLSAVEDVDVMELTTRLAQQQAAYNSVLKSTSMIMQMSLLNYL